MAVVPARHKAEVLGRCQCNAYLCCRGGYGEGGIVQELQVSRPVKDKDGQVKA